MDEKDYIRKLNAKGISVIEIFEFDITNHTTGCSICGKKFDRDKKLSGYQHFIDKHMDTYVPAPFIDDPTRVIENPHGDRLCPRCESNDYGFDTPVNNPGFVICGNCGHIFPDGETNVHR